MAFDCLLLDRPGIAGTDRPDGSGIATITVNRPAVLNALDSATLDELRRVVLDLERDNSVRVVILTGAGDKAFVAGADVKELAGQTPAGARQHALTGQYVFGLIERYG